MMSTSRPAARASRTCLGVAMSLSFLILTACSAEADTPQSGAATTAGKRTAVLETSMGAYKFTPTSCGVYNEDGVDDIEVQGPGTAPDGEKFYFELSSTGNEMTIDLGVDGPFVSAKRQLKAGRHVSQEFTITVSERTLSVSGLVLVDENGRHVDRDATLKIDCGA